MARKLLGRFLYPSLLALVVTGAVVGVALAIDQNFDGTCVAGDVCNYRDSFRTGLIASATGSDSDYSNDTWPGTGTSLNDSVTSMWNRKSSYDVLWYPFADYGNSAFGHACLNPGQFTNEVPWYFNDVFSSHLVAVGGC